jgi:hypothetical protein
MRLQRGVFDLGAQGVTGMLAQRLRNRSGAGEDGRRHPGYKKA